LPVFEVLEPYSLFWRFLDIEGVHVRLERKARFKSGTTTLDLTVQGLSLTAAQWRALF